jgi:hypothetical protein
MYIYIYAYIGLYIYTYTHIGFVYIYTGHVEDDFVQVMAIAEGRLEVRQRLAESGYWVLV